jgi:hypothetical protein
LNALEGFLYEVSKLFLTPVLAALGTRVLFDHHAVLLPTPFL